MIPRAVFFNPVHGGEACPACCRCFAAPTHLIQISGSLSGFGSTC